MSSLVGNTCRLFKGHFWSQNKELVGDPGLSRALNNSCKNQWESIKKTLKKLKNTFIEEKSVTDLPLRLRLEMLGSY